MLPLLLARCWCLHPLRSHPQIPRQGWVFSIENDLFGGKGTSTDRWYTNGFQYAESFRRDRLPGLLVPVRDIGKTLLGEGTLPNGPTVAVSFRQDVSYTPQIIQDPNPQVLDRPWAGFIYLGVGVFDYSGDDHRALDMKVGSHWPGIFG